MRILMIEQQFQKNWFDVKLPEYKYRDEWEGDFDTAGIDYQNKRTRFRVVAVSC